MSFVGGICFSLFWEKDLKHRDVQQIFEESKYPTPQWQQCWKKRINTKRWNDKSVAHGHSINHQSKFCEIPPWNIHNTNFHASSAIVKKTHSCHQLGRILTMYAPPASMGAVPWRTFHVQKTKPLFGLKALAAKRHAMGWQVNKFHLFVWFNGTKSIVSWRHQERTQARSCVVLLGKRRQTALYLYILFICM